MRYKYMSQLIPLQNSVRVFEPTLFVGNPTGTNLNPISPKKKEGEPESENHELITNIATARITEKREKDNQSGIHELIGSNDPKIEINIENSQNDIGQLIDLQNDKDTSAQSTCLGLTSTNTNMKTIVTNGQEDVLKQPLNQSKADYPTLTDAEVEINETDDNYVNLIPTDIKPRSLSKDLNSPIRKEKDDAIDGIAPNSTNQPQIQPSKKVKVALYKKTKPCNSSPVKLISVIALGILGAAGIWKSQCFSLKSYPMPNGHNQNHGSNQDSFNFCKTDVSIGMSNTLEELTKGLNEYLNGKEISKETPQTPSKETLSAPDGVDGWNIEAFSQDREGCIVAIKKLSSLVDQTKILGEEHPNFADQIQAIPLDKQKLKYRRFAIISFIDKFGKVMSDNEELFLMLAYKVSFTEKNRAFIEYLKSTFSDKISEKRMKIAQELCELNPTLYLPIFIPHLKNDIIFKSFITKLYPHFFTSVDSPTVLPIGDGKNDEMSKDHTVDEISNDLKSATNELLGYQKPVRSFDDYTKTLKDKKFKECFSMPILERIAKLDPKGKKHENVYEAEMMIFNPSDGIESWEELVKEERTLVKFRSMMLGGCPMYKEHFDRTISQLNSIEMTMERYINATDKLKAAYDYLCNPKNQEAALDRAKQARSLSEYNYFSELMGKLPLSEKISNEEPEKELIKIAIRTIMKIASSNIDTKDYKDTYLSNQAACILKGILVQEEGEWRIMQEEGRWQTLSIS